MGLSNNQKTEEKLLLLQIQKGNKHSFNKIYEKYWQQAFSNAYKLLKDHDSAKDVVQDVFVTIWKKRENTIDNFPAYLYIAVRNRAFKELAKKKKEIPYLDFLGMENQTMEQTEENIYWKEFIKAYKKILPTLPEKRQKIFRLRYHEEMTTKDIAKEMGITRKTVQNQLRKAVIQLRAALLQFLIFLLIITPFF